jgi:FAD/FMN-containing dehydrogenase
MAYTNASVKALKDNFPDDCVAISGTSDYDKLNRSYLSLLQSELTPAAIFLPRNKDDVAKFVRLLKPLVLDGNVGFAIRGAGQQPVPGCSNIENPGITIDLQHLTGIEVKDGVVSLGAGERWGAIYEKLSEQGLGVTGSRSSLGGIGGLALAGTIKPAQLFFIILLIVNSGGLSFFSSREDFICDNVVSYEVVLSDGSIINANANENCDLWKALRGGGNNFGIVTRFNLKTFKQGPFWGGAVYYFPSSFASQVQAYCDELHKSDASTETHIMVSQGYSHVFAALGGHFCMNQVYYTREEERPAVLEPFVSVQPQLESMNSMRMMTLKEAASEQANQSSDGIRYVLSISHHELTG